MGHIVHHAIVCTSFDAKVANAARKAAVAIGCSVTPLIKPAVNGEHSFLIGPDGSKSGWGDSETGDEQRDEWIAWAISQRYEDNSSPLAWVEIEYGSDDRTAKVSRHEWAPVPDTQKKQ